MPKFNISRILAPTDFSELATHALHYAGELAKRTGSELVVLYADPFLPPPHFTSAQVDSIASSLAAQKKNAGVELDKYTAANVSMDVRHRTMIVEAHPVSAIVQAAEELDASVIVMGTHGRSGLNRFMLGSVTERVLRESSRPLLTVRPTNRAVEATPASPTILCPVSVSKDARAVLEQAIDFAELVGAKITVVNVGETSESRDDGALREIQSWIPERAGVPVSTISLAGNPAEVVVEHARKSNADLIIIGARHRPFADTTTIGTTTTRITRHAPCPVLTIHTGLGAGRR
ncbi:MAG: universal stress protein [Thermoanaerobaculia bacterium]|nr:universal stress protein [Thermoanaerobaculia bacterium]